MYFFRKLFKQDQSLQARKNRRLKEGKKVDFLIHLSHLGPTIILFLFCSLVVILSFWGLSPAGPQILPNHLSKIRVSADFPFSYVSHIKTEKLKNQKRLSIAPIYTISLKQFEPLYLAIEELENKLKKLQDKLSPYNEDTVIQKNILAITKEINTTFGTEINYEDILDLVKHTNFFQRQHMLTEGLHILSNIVRKGIYDFSLLGSTIQEGAYLFHIQNYKPGNATYQTQEEALRALRLHISALDTNPKIIQALFGIFKQGICTNLTYDVEQTKASIDQAISNIKPVEIFVDKGQVMIEPGSMITEEDYEVWQAYRAKKRIKEEDSYGFNFFLLQHIAATILIILTTIVYIKVAFPHFRSSKRYRILPALLILLNLAFIRTLSELGESLSWTYSTTTSSLFPLASPISFAPLLTTLLIGQTPAILVAILVSAFNALMQGTDLIFFFIYSLSSLIAIYMAGNTRKRSKVLYAGLIAGFTCGLSSGIINIFEHFYTCLFWEQLIITTSAGFFCGLLANALRAPLENLFHITTDFTLLELTDYNHPLLRRLQLEAPGTYHHSLMVATLSERAACQIKANPLLCRTASLFHDIGKLIKPEYFIENQHQDDNPHEALSPSISAIIIKSHIKEGIELAKNQRLPKPIVDIIQEHHGSTLIQYFYQKAKKEAQEGQVIEEAHFRYDGPKPKSKESAIIFFADAIEAASRSLKKISHQNITQLVNYIVEERIGEHQLDDSPLTLSEIHLIKESFIFTLMNMLHSRISYPNQTKLQ